MDAFHSFWSRPNMVKNRGQIKFPDYELLTMMLSALKWKETNGPITMVTDWRGAEFFEKNGLLDLWSRIDTGLDDMDPDIDPFLFWAAGKLFALQHMDCPCVMLDTDLIIWKDLGDLFQCDVAGAHYEQLTPEVYPDVQTFQMKESYRFPQEWNFGVKAINTAFLFIREAAFRDYYVKCAKEFVYGIGGQGFDPITAMCFAEQRVLGMCAEAKGMQVKCLVQIEHANQQDFVTHLWGQKQKLKTSHRKQKEFCVRCIGRIIQDFPEYESVIANNKKLSEYYEEHRRKKK